ncbi:MAG: hypothetical protein MUE40_19495 [Anaerolineae bacterium]|nr:hypothetical protein [Anaerolineae bacterium]
MTVEQVDAVLGIFATLIPLLLAALGAFFGLQNRRRKSTPAPSLTIIHFERETETAAQRSRRRTGQIAVLVAGISGAGLLVVFMVGRVNTLADLTTTAQQAIFGFLLAITLFYLLLVGFMLRNLRDVLRTPAGTPSPAHTVASLVVEADRTALAPRIQSALRRLNMALLKVDTDAGTYHARRYYAFNVAREFADDIVIRLEPVEGGRCRLTLSSDGIMPTLKSDRARNRENVDELIRLILK